MNAVREINRINQRELELGVADKGSWHDEYKDSAYVFIGGLPFDLTEGDVIIVFSQFGEVMDINMPRDKETGKVRGFGFLMYEDQRSTVLAVDNMNGSLILGRTIRVDHCRKYKQKGSKNEDGDYVEPENPTYNAMPPTLDGSESESSDSEEAGSLDGEDPMTAFLRAEKKKAKAKAVTNGKEKGKKRKHEGETKEARRARKEAKKAKRAAKERRMVGHGDTSVRDIGLKDKEKRRDDRREDEAKRVDAGTSRVENGDRYGRTGDGEGSSERPGRANRDDWRQGRWEMERDERDTDRKERPSGPDNRDDERRRDLRRDDRAVDNRRNGDDDDRNRRRDDYDRAQYRNDDRRDRRPEPRDERYGRDDERNGRHEDRDGRNERSHGDLRLH